MFGRLPGKIVTGVFFVGHFLTTDSVALVIGLFIFSVFKPVLVGYTFIGSCPFYSHSWIYGIKLVISNFVESVVNVPFIFFSFNAFKKKTS